MKKQCGKCKYWMLLNQCPREYPIEGGHRGAAGNEPPCDKFKWSDWYKDEAIAELNTSYSYDI